MNHDRDDSTDPPAVDPLLQHHLLELAKLVDWLEWHCRHCGAEVGRLAERCWHCGHNRTIQF